MKEEYFMDGKCEPTNEGYAIAKIAGLKLCEYIHTQYNKQFISCMPTNLYGPWDNFDPKHSHVIPSLIGRMHEAKINWLSEVTIRWSGNGRREFLYVDDLAEACIWLMNNYTEKQFLNIGTGEDISIKELAYIIKDIVGYVWTLVFDTSKPDGMPKKLLDVTRITEVGRKYHTSLMIGLKESYQYFLNM